jgi:glycerol-3-phosphate dehydrogenase (NAD(P)+)
MSLGDCVAQNVGILGLGAWGSALGIHLSEGGIRVTGFVRDPACLPGFFQDRRSLCHAGYNFNQLWDFTSSLEPLQDVPVLLVCIPSKQLVSAFEGAPFVGSRFTERFAGIVVSCVKGIGGHRDTPSVLLGRIFRNSRIAVLSGPSFASDVVNAKPVSIVSASSDIEVAKFIAKLFTRRRMRIYTSTDVVGVEWGGILKNVISIVVGIADGSGWGDSARAAIITRGLAEMVRFSTSFGALRETLHGLSGLGDLVMTASSDLSRNRQFGLMVGSLGVIEAQRVCVGTVEGVQSLPFVIDLARERGVDMPLAFTLSEVLKGSISPLNGLELLLARPLKNE